MKDKMLGFRLFRSVMVLKAQYEAARKELRFINQTRKRHFGKPSYVKLPEIPHITQSPSLDCFVQRFVDQVPAGSDSKPECPGDPRGPAVEFKTGKSCAIVKGICMGVYNIYYIYIYIYIYIHIYVYIYILTSACMFPLSAGI